MTLETKLVRHLRDMTFRKLPAASIDAARRQVLWALGTSVAGAGAVGSQQVVDFVRLVGGREEATVLGFGDRAPASLAGLANGCFAKALEFEDKVWIDESHGCSVGGAVVCGAFAAAEHLGGVSGKALLTAVAATTDLQVRLVNAVGGRGDLVGNTSGWSLSYTFAAFGAAMAAGKLLQLDEQRYLSALGLAYTQATGNLQALTEGVLAVRMQLGFGVRNGVTAAQLANLGVSGPTRFLTGRYGLFPHFFQQPELDASPITMHLGERFDNVRLGFKAYPCGAVAHPVLDAVLSLASDVDPANIKRVRVHGTTHLRVMSEPRQLRQNPTTHAEAEFSLPWVIACALIDGRLLLSHYSNSALADERYRRLARLVEVDSNMDRPEDRKGVYVEITAGNDRYLRSPTVLAAKGHPDNPQSTSEMSDRILECLEFSPRRLPPEQRQRAIDRILHLENLADATDVMRLLVPPPAPLVIA